MIRYITQADMLKCQFGIMDISHYREDGSCKCDDPLERVKMIKEWGYKSRQFKGIKLQTLEVKD